MSQISITDLTFAYDGSFDRVFESVSLVLDTNWRLGLIGRNGKGKTTFLKLLMGKYEYRGNISCDLDFEYFPYDIPDKSQNCIDIANVICEDILQWQLERELNLLELDPEILWRSFETLSFGERTKLLLGILFPTFRTHINQNYKQF